MKTVSVIIPVYNTAEYIEQCVQSVLEQSYNNIEVLIVNDNSTDNSLTLLKEMQAKDERIKIFNFDKRVGVGAARNFAIKKAMGQFIYFLDSDDYLPENTIEYLITHIGVHNIIRGRMKSTNLSSSFAVVFDGVFKPKMFLENRFNLLKDFSAVNFLISKKIIIENDFRFSEDLEIYTDLNFMIPVLSKMEAVPYLNEALYFKRKRNDPILNPALSQYSQDQQIVNFLKMYEQQKGNTKNRLANTFLDTQFLNFYRKRIITYFKHDSYINEFYDTLSKLTRLVEPSLIREYDSILKRELKHILNGDKRKYRKMINRHNFYRDLKDGLKSKGKFYNFLYKRFFTKLPLNKNLIFFESFAGKGYSDSPKYIYEYLLENRPDLKFVWSFSEDEVLPGKGKKVKRSSLMYYYNLARSKYWITNARMPNNLMKREDCIYLQTWHGTPLKKLAGDLQNVFMPGTNSATYKMNFSNETAKWDYLVSPNAYSSEIFKRAFWFKGELLEFGYPRNDVLYNKNNNKDIHLIKDNLNLPLDKKVILYAPTWRDDEYYSVGKYQFSLQLDLENMQKELGDEYIIILRMHYLIASELDISQYASFVYDFSSYSDISELYLVADILITDYSSVFFDYANLRRPILFYTYDLDKYRDELRGFYLDIENEVPGPLLETTGEIINAVNNIEQINTEYALKYDLFYDRMCEWDDGNASKNIVDKIIK